MSNEKRAPLLSDDDMVRWHWDENANGERSYWSDPWDINEVRDYYEDLITRGELMVVKTVKPKWTGGDLRYQGTWECPNCRRRWYPSESPEVGEFCVCGLKIIE